MKKKLLIITLFMAIGLYFAVQFFFSFNASLFFNFDFTVPFDADYRQVYEKHSKASLGGEGIRYHVVSYENEEVIDEVFDGKKISVDKMNEIYVLLDEIDEKENIPDMTKCLYWNMTKNDDELMVLIDKNSRLLYIIEVYI